LYIREVKRKENSKTNCKPRINAMDVKGINQQIAMPTRVRYKGYDANWGYTIVGGKAKK
jgi:hypothetical protein